MIEANDGLQAVERLQECQVQLALLDENTPGQRGLEAAREIRKQCPEIKIALMSAAFEHSGALDLAAIGVDGVFPKTAAPEVLLETVRRLLGS